MDRQELVKLGAWLKKIISDSVPAQNVTATAGLRPDSDVVSLSFYITPQSENAEARRGQIH